ncbi:unnamed protein product, partial [Rotaria socialis]
MNKNGSLYVVNNGNVEARRYPRGESQGTVVAGGNGRENHRVMKWMEGARQGIVMTGGQEQGNGLTQLSYREGVVVDQLGTVCVADSMNHRIVRWPKGATQGSVIVGGKVEGGESNQLYASVG